MIISIINFVVLIIVCIRDGSKPRNIVRMDLTVRIHSLIRFRNEPRLYLDNLIKKRGLVMRLISLLSTESANLLAHISTEVHKAVVRVLSKIDSTVRSDPIFDVARLHAHKIASMWGYLLRCSSVFFLAFDTT
jgi:hypothetical protein